MSKHITTVDAECPTCGGTGLYKGFGERSTLAVQCSGCGGKGHKKLVFQYCDFKGRKPSKGITHIIPHNPGVVLDENSAGIPLAQWESLKYTDAEVNWPKGSELREYCCPLWWYQNTGTHAKPSWLDCEWGAFADCKHFPHKNKCWIRWDKEQKPKKAIPK